MREMLLAVLVCGISWVGAAPVVGQEIPVAVHRLVRNQLELSFALDGVKSPFPIEPFGLHKCLDVGDWASVFVDRASTHHRYTIGFSNGIAYPLGGFGEMELLGFSRASRIRAVTPRQAESAALVLLYLTDRLGTACALSGIKNVLDADPEELSRVPDWKISRRVETIEERNEIRVFLDIAVTEVVRPTRTPRRYAFVFDSTGTLTAWEGRSGIQP